MAILDPNEVENLGSFIRFAREVSRELEMHPDAYMNVSSSDFLEGAAAWLEDAQSIDPYISSFEEWKFVARLIAAGLIYE
ncbi:hypothetical protein ACFXNW_26245 [Nocardia sp. NPDC059180]|uniref:DUF7660 family protein n=1 Tax=Nocardia sp. NPDC059180 TaxID=3346761 RepID=UPI00367872A8